MSSKITRIFFVMLFIPLVGLSFGKYSGGSGTAEAPYLIATPNDLNDIGNHIEDYNKHFIMVNDINLAEFTGTQFNIIGDYPDFTGVFDGNNHAITNFTYGVSSSGGSLILMVDGPAAVIKNVIMINADVNEPSDTGVACLVGFLYEGLVSNCHIINGRVNAENFSGLLVGKNESQIVNCSSSGICYGMDHMGGLVGETREQGTIINCDSDANVIVKWGMAGGLVGFHNGDLIVNCHSTGKIVGLGSSGEIGGLVGYNSSVIEQCYSTAEVIGGNDEGVGGLVGINNGTGTVSKCFATGDVSGIIDVGGLVGYNYSDGTISDSYSLGDVNALSAAGGLVSGNNGILQRCYSAGKVSGPQPGGLVSHGPGTIITCFWDIEASDCNVSDGGTGLPTAQMQMRSTFADAGWDFVGETANGYGYEDIWRMCQDGVDYPKLSWQFSEHGDLTCPDGVDFIDYSVLANQWQLERLEQDYNSDGRVNFKDWSIFANNWDGNYTELSSFLDCWLARSASQADIAPAGGDNFVGRQDLMLFCENWLLQ